MERASSTAPSWSISIQIHVDDTADFFDTRNISIYPMGVCLFYLVFFHLIFCMGHAIKNGFGLILRKNSSFEESAMR